MTFDECLKKGLVKKDASVVKMAQASVQKAEKFLSAVRLNLEGKQYDTAVIAGYNSIFCCNQALLFSKGFVEHSHSCLIVAIRELFKDKNELIQMLDSVDDVRITRHRIQYSGLDADLLMSEFVSGLARDYLELTKELLKC